MLNVLNVVNIYLLVHEVLKGTKEMLDVSVCNHLEVDYWKVYSNLDLILLLLDALRWKDMLD